MTKWERIDSGPLLRLLRAPTNNPPGAVEGPLNINQNHPSFSMTFNSEKGKQVLGQFSLLGYSWGVMIPSISGVDLPEAELLAANEEFSHYTVTRDLYWCGESIRSFLHGEAETALYLAQFCEPFVEGAAIADQFNIARGVGPPLLDAFAKMNKVRNQDHVMAAVRIIELYNAMGELYDRRDEVLSTVGASESEMLDSCFDQLKFVLEEFQRGSELSSFAVYPLSFILAQVVPNFMDSEPGSLVEKGLVPAIHEVTEAISTSPEKVSEIMTNLFGASAWIFTKMILDTELLGLISRCFSKPNESVSARVLLSRLICAPTAVAVYPDETVVLDPLSYRVARIESSLRRGSHSVDIKSLETALSSEIKHVSQNIKNREARLQSRGYFVSMRESLEDRLHLVLLRHLGQEKYEGEEIAQAIRPFLRDEDRNKKISIVRGQFLEDGSPEENLVLDSITGTVADIAEEIVKVVGAISIVYKKGGPYQGTIGTALYCRFLNDHLETTMLRSGWNPILEDRANIKSFLTSFDAEDACARLQDSMLNLVRDRTEVAHYIESDIRPAINRLVPIYPSKTRFSNLWVGGQWEQRPSER